MHTLYLGEVCDGSPAAGAQGGPTAPAAPGVVRFCFLGHAQVIQQPLPPLTLLPGLLLP